MNTRIVLTSAIVDLLVEELLLSNTNVCHPYTDVVFNFTINNGKIKEMSVSEYEINDKFNRGLY